MRLLLNLLERTSGIATLLDRDAVRDTAALRQRIGVVADGQTLYDWMTVNETLWFCRGFYRQWDDAYTTEMQRQMALDPAQKVGQLSAGQQAKLKLLLALAHRPELLLLDEPTGGMDVLVRRDYLDSIIRVIQEEGRTVFFSSHLIHEVERIADWVGILDRGRLLRCAPLDQLKQEVRRIVLTFDVLPTGLTARLPGVLAVDVLGRQVSVTVDRFNDDTLASVQALHPLSCEVHALGLEDIFAALVTGEVQI